MEEVNINTEYIKLNQLLKLTGIISMGSDTKALIDEKKVLLNGTLVTELRKKIYNNDIVSVDGQKIKVICT